MTDAWRAAVEAMKAADGCDHYTADTHLPDLCDACLEIQFRAALPHALRAVVERMDQYDAIGLRVGDEAFYGRDVQWRDRLLSDLIAAAQTLDESQEG